MPVAHLHAYYYIYMLGTGEEAQHQPRQLKEQDQVDEVLKIHEQIVLTFKEVEKEIESLDNTFAVTFKSYILEARGQLAKIQVHCNYSEIMTILILMNQTTNLDMVYSQFM